MPKEELISALKEKVHQNQGNVGLCWRNFSFPGEITGDLIPPIPHKVLHYVAGQICGEFVEYKKLQTEILHNLVLGFGSVDLGESHIIFADYGIPSEGVLKKKANGRLFSASSGEWEKLLDGDYISFSLEELDNTFKDPLVQMVGNSNPLKDFGLCFGEGEIREFCEEKNLEFDEEGFEFLLDSEKRKGFIEGHYTKEREMLGENLVRSVSKLKYFEAKLRSVEERVLSSTCWLVREQDGHYEEWSNKEAVNKYWDLRGSAGKSLSETQSFLTSAKEKKLERLGKISGKVIGFPGSVEVETYLDYASSLNNSTKDLIADMNQHLAAAKKKAYSS